MRTPGYLAKRTNESGFHFRSPSASCQARAGPDHRQVVRGVRAEPARHPYRQGHCVVGLLLVTALMRSVERLLARRVARAMLVWPLLRW